MKSILILNLIGLTVVALSPQSSSAGITLAIGTTPATTASVTYPDGNVQFMLDPPGQMPNNAMGTATIVNYAATTLISSATLSYSSATDNGANFDRLIETYTNNTGRNIAGLTISLANVSGSITGFQSTNVYRPVTVQIGSTGSAGSPGIPLITGIYPQLVTTNSGSSLTFNFASLLTIGSSVSFYIPTFGSSASTTAGSFTLTESALVTPEPSTLISSLCGALALGGMAVARSNIRRRKGLISQVGGPESI